MDRAEAMWAEMAGAEASPSEVSWDDKWAMAFVLMYDVTGKVRLWGSSSVCMCICMLNFVSLYHAALRFRMSTGRRWMIS